MSNTKPATLRIGTRASTLALAQAGSVAAELRSRGYDTELIEITTKGDASSAPLASIGGTGVFASALREALLDGRVDIAVHSLKDLPTTPADGLAIAAVPVREDPRDVLCSRDDRKLADLPSGARIGTGSPRRAAQLRGLGLGLDVADIRGNVESRLQKMHDGLFDAIVLARAGLARIDRLDVMTEVIEPIQVLPAPGQGALAVECRADDRELVDAVSELDDADARAAVTAERSLLAVLEAGCTAPVGAYAEVAEGDSDLELYIRAVVASHDGAVIIRKSATGPVGKAEQLGHELAQELLADGAGAVVDAGEPVS